MDLNVGRLREYVALTRKKKQLSEELKKVEEEIARTGEWMVNHFTDTGTRRFTLTGTDGMPYTCNPRRELHVTAVNGTPLLVEELLKNDSTKWLLTYSPQRMKSWIKDLAGESKSESDDDDDSLPLDGTKSVEELMALLPENLRQHVALSEVYKMGVRKA